MALLALDTAAATPPKEAKPAVLKISGYGLLGNRELKRILKTVELSGKKPELFGPAFVEDSALLLAARLKGDGYLRPRITIELGLAEGKEIAVQASDLLENPLDRSLRFRSVEFQIQKGLLYYFQTIEFNGLQSVDAKQARSFFVETAILLHTRKSRVFTPERMHRGEASLTDTLDSQGYHEALVQAAETRRDDQTGAVKVRVQVREGPKFMVQSVREEFFYDKAAAPAKTNSLVLHRPYSKLWQQDFAQSLKTNLYHQGYPDTTVEVRTLARRSQDEQVQLDLLATIKTGEPIRIGAVNFEGQKRTRLSLLSRRVRVQRGELLDRIKVEEGRYRLAQLGAFDTVDLTYNPVNEHVRDVIYHVKEGKEVDLNLLFGYGSYELLRGGVDAELYNLWGLGHHAHFKAVQSFKSSSGEFVYTVPELLPRDVDLFANASGLLRQEPSFTREEYGGGLGTHKYFKSLSTDLTLGYSYQILNAADAFPAVATEGLTNPAVGSIIMDLKYDRRDNPLYPRKGFKFFATVETASDSLGGDANYERIDASASWYHPLGGGRYLSLSLSQGAAISFGSPAENFPFNKRFFPGGANSIRGYPEGEASPRNAQGAFVGAECYALATVQLEQALTPKWSFVLFSDSLGFAHSLTDYPFDTELFSVGAGLWWRTIIGPVRLEYGYNLNPRKGDPSGTVQFSLGFPF